MSNQGKSDFGVIGLAVMGRNLALNINDHKFSVAAWNLEQPMTDKFIAENQGRTLTGTKSLAELVGTLERPRRLLMMIMAGKPVDSVLEQLKPLLEKGDIVIDGGNTHFQETRRREADLAKLGINFVGMGVSGGEEGARFGPALMPGGTNEAWERLKPVLESIAAKTESGPCVTHCGPDGAGHFVKMVHNGIEYGDMQLIAEAYDLLSRGLGMSAPEIGEVFAKWNEGALASFLIELTAKVLVVKDQETGKPLVDLVQDKAGQKGTGKWTAELSLDLGIPIPTITAAIDGRVLSSMKDQRVAAAKKIRGVTGAAPSAAQKQEMLAAIHDALLASKICSYAQGMQLIQAGSAKYNWNISMKETARIWKGGCIIRARLLDNIMKAYERAPELKNLLLDEDFEGRMHDAQPNWRKALGVAQTLGIPTPSFSASLAYFDSYRTARLPQNLTQAQRDAFGAHTYERTDKPEKGFVHSEWLKD
ncbi:MAG TPA: NADP-dependent phosphogluconate dehydrogenase [Polyangia bacterium]|jgi:6-phosphogluconate dehydrogenase|nr:NADP-dependent phosphogluconate dehydrogenase [Polyangia bacterium]